MSETINRQDAIVCQKMHLFFLIDRSASMEGAPMQEINALMDSLPSKLSHVAGSWDVDIIFHVLAYNTEVQWLCGTTAEAGILMDQFQWHEIRAGGGKNTAGAMRAILPGLSRKCLGYRDHAPILILITDGKGYSWKETGDAIFEVANMTTTRRIAFGVKGYDPGELEYFASYERLAEFDEFGDPVSDGFRRFVFPVDEAAKRIADVIKTLVSFSYYTDEPGLAGVQVSESWDEIESFLYDAKYPKYPEDAGDVGWE